MAHINTDHDYEHCGKWAEQINNTDDINNLTRKVREHLPRRSVECTSQTYTPPAPPSSRGTRHASSTANDSPYARLYMTKDGNIEVDASGEQINPILYNANDEDEEVPDVRPLSIIYPTSPKIKYTRSSLPNRYDDDIGKFEGSISPQIQPYLYSSCPKPARKLSNRASRKQLELKGVSTCVTDERKGHMSNVDIEDPRITIGSARKVDKKKRRAHYTLPPKVLQDASHSCYIEVDDSGCLLSVVLTDDLAGTDLRFGRQQILFQPLVDPTNEVSEMSAVSKRKPRQYKVGMKYYAPTTDFFNSMQSGLYDLKVKKPKRYRLKQRWYKGGLKNVPDVYEVTSTHELRPTSDIWTDTADLTGRATVPVAGAANKYDVIPEERAGELSFDVRDFGLDRKPYVKEESSSSSEEELPSAVRKEMVDAEALTEADWMLDRDTLDAIWNSTLHRASLEDLEFMQRQQAPRYSYPGGYLEYVKRLNSLNRRTVIPDMACYAMSNPDDLQMEQQC